MATASLRSIAKNVVNFLFNHGPPTRAHHLRLSGEAKTRAALSLVEDGVDGLEEDVAEDRKATKTLVGLDTAEAVGSRDGCEVDVRAGNSEDLATNVDVEVRELGRAGEDVATLGVAVGSAGDLTVVCGDGSIRDEEESGAGVGNSLADAARGGGGATGAVAAGVELPEALAGVHRDIGDGAGVLGAVNVAEVVSTSGSLLQVDSEQRLSKRALDSVEEGRLLLRLNSVNAAECQAEKAVGIRVLGEGGRDRSCSFDCLRGGSDGSNDDLVGVDIATGAGAISVTDLPGLSGQLPSRSRRVVLGVASGFAGRCLGREDPANEVSVGVRVGRHC